MTAQSFIFYFILYSAAPSQLYLKPAHTVFSMHIVLTCIHKNIIFVCLLELL